MFASCSKLMPASFRRNSLKSHSSHFVRLEIKDSGRSNWACIQNLEYYHRKSSECVVGSHI